jgi:hypothetical protein
MNTTVDLADLDAEIDSVERTLTTCREGGHKRLTAAVEREIARDMLPGIAALAALAEGEERAALAARYRRLETTLRTDLAQRKARGKRRPRG